VKHHLIFGWKMDGKHHPLCVHNDNSQITPPSLCGNLHSNQKGWGRDLSGPMGFWVGRKAGRAGDAGDCGLLPGM
jgi:hypothetical protein